MSFPICHFCLRWKTFLAHIRAPSVSPSWTPTASIAPGRPACISCQAIKKALYAYKVTHGASESSMTVSFRYLRNQLTCGCIALAVLVSHRYCAVSYTHLRAHETDSYLVCRLLLEKKKYAVFCLKKKNSFFFFFFLMIRRQPRSTHCISSAASDVYKRQV